VNANGKAVRMYELRYYGLPVSRRSGKEYRKMKGESEKSGFTTRLQTSLKKISTRKRDQKKGGFLQKFLGIFRGKAGTEKC